MNEVMTFQNGTFGKVRTVQIDSAPWFVAKDIALALDYRDAEKMTRNLDDDEKLIHTLWVSGQNRETTVINESGLYHAVLISRKPQAKAFRKWITSEVLPQIARNGYYGAEKDRAFLAMENEYLRRENALLHKMERMQNRFSKKSTKLTAAEKARIVSLSKTMSVMEICRAVNRSESAVRSALKNAFRVITYPKKE